MKKRKKIFSAIAAVALLFQTLTLNVAAVETVTAPEPWGPLPSQSQVDYHEEELSAFIHFGVNTYTNSEWGNGQENPNVFNPTNLDTDQWVKTLKDAGFKRVIMIGRHHDGFCLWKSDYTEHDVGSSTDFQDNNEDGDVLLSISKSCTKYDMDMGLYLSPWDANNESYGYGTGTNDETDSNDDYNKYYTNQLKEVLGDPKYGNNGKFVEVWMDGAKGTGAAAQKYNLLNWFDLIEELEPGALVFSTYGSGIRWVGNERGIAGDPCWSKIKQGKMRNAYDNGFEEAGYLNSGDPDGDIWSIGEADVSITSGWFFHNGNQPKDMATLTDIYFKSVGRGQPLLLNVPPNREGKFTDEIVERIKEFGNAVKTTFDEDLVEKEGVNATASAVRGDSNSYDASKAIDNNEDTYWTMNDGQKTGSLTVNLNGFKSFDVVSIEEYIKLGQRISDFNVEVHTAAGWQEFGNGHTIGAKRLTRNAPVNADQVRINITGSQAVPLIKEVGIFKSAKAFEIPKLMPDGVTTIDNPQLAMTGSWTQESVGNNNTSMYSTATGATASATFTGTKAWIYGTKDNGHGIMEVWIDNEKVSDVDTYRSSRQLPALLYTTDTLSNGEHTIKVVVKGTKNASSTGNAIGLDFISYLSNNGAGMFEIDKDSYTVNEGETQQIKINRLGGTNGEATVKFFTSPDSAVHGRHYKDIITDVTFADGQSTATVEVETIDNTEIADNLQFLGQLGEPTNGAILGFQTSTTVVIKNNDYSGTLDDILEVAKTKNIGNFTGESWKVFESAYTNARTIKEKPNASADEVSKAVNDLSKAIDSLQARTSFTSEDPFVFPKRLGNNVMAEAEFFNLVPTTPLDRHVRVEDIANASNGKMVTWFENGDKIELPYTTKDKGTFTVKVTYNSGRPQNNPNKINWSGENITSGSVSVFGPDSTIHQTISFDIEVNKAGDGELIFSADSSSCPNIDKFEITAKTLEKQALIEYVDDCEKLKAADYSENSFATFISKLDKANEILDAVATKTEIDTALAELTEARENLKVMITTIASNGGTVSDSQEVLPNNEVTITATPNKNYRFVNWTKDGEEVSTSTSYTFTATNNASYQANFEVVLDIRALNEAITKADKVDLSKYIDGTEKTTFVKVLKEAKEMQKNPTTQEAINKILAKLTSAQNNLKVETEKPKEEISNEEGNIIVGNIEESGVSLITKEINGKEVTSITDKIQNQKFMKKIDVEQLFDISLLKDGKAYTQKGTMRVKIALTEEMKSKKHLGIIYINGDKVENVPFTIEDGYIVFETTHVSHYAIVSAAKPIDQLYKESVDGNEPVPPTKPGEGTTPPTEKPVDNPKKPTVTTGDTTEIGISMMLLVASGCLLIWDKRKKMLRK